jgi:diguanylate cyclase
VFDRAQRGARTLVAQLDLLRAQRESRLDPLTGIVNRRGFEERAQARLSRVRPDEAIALLLIDVDHFKQVNDSQGHAAGDGALRALAEVLRAVCRGTEPPARLGGDEFVVLVDGGAREARALAQRVRDALHRARRDVAAGDAVAPVFTVSIGLASAKGPCTLDALMLRADRALYAAKQGGRDGVAEAAAR